MTTKIKLFLPVLLIATSLGVTHGEPKPPASPNPYNPYGLANRGLVPAAPPAIDPATGLPIPQAVPEWKDPDWKDPEKVLRDVTYDGLPISEVVNDLRQQFTNDFDVLVPNGWSNPLDPNAPKIDPQNYLVKLKLKNVSASEIFNAINLEFDAENVPLRWKLIMNGKRPLAVLRVLPELVPASPPAMIDPATGLPIPATPPPPERKSMVFFIGDLIGDEKSGGTTMENIVETISEVWKLNYPNETGGMDGVRFHKGAQLLVVNADRDHINFLDQVLHALRDKARLNKSAVKPGETKPKAGTESTGDEK